MGQSPKWGDIFKFQTLATDLFVKVYDKDFFDDDYYGSGRVNIAQCHSSINRPINCN